MFTCTVVSINQKIKTREYRITTANALAFPLTRSVELARFVAYCWGEKNLSKIIII